MLAGTYKGKFALTGDGRFKTDGSGEYRGKLVAQALWEKGGKDVGAAGEGACAFKFNVGAGSFDMTALNCYGSGGAKMQKTWYPLSAIPSLAVAAETNRVAAWAARLLAVKTDVSLLARGQAAGKDVSNQLVWDHTSYGIQVPFKGAVALQLWEKQIEAEAGGSGELRWLFKDNLTTDEWSIQAALYAKLRLWRVEHFYERIWQWRGPQPSPYLQADAVAVGPMQRVSGPNLHVVTAGPGEQMMADPVSADANPSLAVGGPNLALAWTSDDRSRPVLQGAEISARLWDGSAWSAPARLTNDTNLDANAAAAYDQTGQTVVLWERNTLVGLPETADIDENLLSHFEIAYSVYSPLAGQWSAPALLTNNSSLDYGPRLVRSADGRLIALWRGNSFNRLGGDAGAPDRVYYALWNGSAWSAPTVAADGLVDVLGWNAAYAGDGAVIAFSCDMDGDPATAEDTELFWARWNGSSWSVPARLTNDDVADVSPAIVYGPDGKARLVWLKGGQVSLLEGDWTTATPATSVIDDSTGLAGFSLAQDAAGRLALVWQDASGQGGDIFYSIYDSSARRWSGRLQLTSDEPVESDVSPIFDAGGSLRLAYTKSLLTYVDRSAQITTGETITITDVPALGSSSLYMITHTLSNDLALLDISTDPSAPITSASLPLTITLANRGRFEPGGNPRGSL